MDPTWESLQTNRLSFDRKRALPEPDAWHPARESKSSVIITDAGPLVKSPRPHLALWPRTVFDSPGALTLANLDACYRFSEAWGGLPEERSVGRFRAVHLGPGIRDSIAYLTFRRPEVILLALGTDGPVADDPSSAVLDLRRVVWTTPEGLPAMIASRFGAVLDGETEDRDVRTTPVTVGTAPTGDLLSYWLTEQFPEPIDLVVATDPEHLERALRHVKVGGSAVVRVMAENAASAADHLARRTPRLLVLMRPMLGGLYLVAMGLQRAGKAVDTKAWVAERLATIAAEKYPQKVDWTGILTAWDLPELPDPENKQRWPGGGFGLQARVLEGPKRRDASTAVVVRKAEKFGGGEVVEGDGTSLVSRPQTHREERKGTF